MDFKNVNPLYYLDKDGKTPIYYGIGVFFRNGGGSKPAIMLRFGNEKDNFKLPDSVTDKKQRRLTALASLVNTKGKLVLGSWGRAIMDTGKEHTYYDTLQVLIQTSKVDVKAQAEKAEKAASGKSDLQIVLEALAKQS